MKDLTEIAKEDLTDKFSDVYKLLDDLRAYLSNKYGITDPDISEVAPNNGCVSFAYASLGNAEQGVMALLNIQKKKIKK